MIGDSNVYTTGHGGEDNDCRGRRDCGVGTHQVLCLYCTPRSCAKNPQIGEVIQLDIPVGVFLHNKNADMPHSDHSRPLQYTLLSLPEAASRVPSFCHYDDCFVVIIRSPYPLPPIFIMSSIVDMQSLDSPLLTLAHSFPPQDHLVPYAPPPHALRRISFALLEPALL